jgi:hypothetical protein
VSRAETLSTTVASVLALITIAGYIGDSIGLGIAPVPVLLLSLGGAALLMRRSASTSSGGAIDSVAWAVIVVVVAAAVIRPGWPSLLPPGRGPDLTHHLLLVDYIERAGHLVHDRSLDGSMGEMAHYTPGAHLLAVVAGSLAGVDGLRAFFPLLVLCAALTAGFVYLIARRLQLPAPYAITAVLLLFLPAQYFHGAFTHDAFLAQTVATFFAVAAWWALVVWDEERTAVTAALFSIFTAATFLAWPVFVGPLVLVFLSLAWQSDRRFRDVAIGLVPVAIAAAAHVAGRWGWLAIVRTSGAVLQPSMESVGWLLPLLATAGIYISVRNRKARTTIVLVFAIVLQAVTLFVIAKAQGADTPYMAFKMVYLAIYPAAVLGAVAIANPDRVVLTRRRVHSESRGVSGWIIATLLLVLAVRPALTAPRVVPVVDLDLYEAGRWTRANVGQTCVDYLVGDAQTAYWLHLAVLGNPRASARMQEIDVYDPRAAMGTWITTDGRAYAIADLRQLPDEVRSRVEIVRTFGHAVVLRRKEPLPAMMGDCDLRR